MVTNRLPVKVIRDDAGRPFLYRYHLFSLSKDGPGIAFHHFVKSDPDRGYHDHPWSRSLSFILCGGYSERILDESKPKVVTDSDNPMFDTGYRTVRRKRWTFNYLNGHDTFHRVMIGDDQGSDSNQDAWSIFFYGKRSKVWGMVSLEGQYNPMTDKIKDSDGGWWRYVQKGLGIHSRLKLKGPVIATVDSIILSEQNQEVLLIKRGKEPFKGQWAFPGGRIEPDDHDMETACLRETEEETGLSGIQLKCFKTVGNSSRDPRGFCVTNFFTASIDKSLHKVKAGDDAVDCQWFDINDLPNMAFDHRQILDEALGSIR